MRSSAGDTKISTATQTPERGAKNQILELESLKAKASVFSPSWDQRTYVCGND